MNVKVSAPLECNDKSISIIDFCEAFLFWY